MKKEKTTKRKTTLVLLTALALMLCACAETPDSVKKSSDSAAADKTVEDTASVTENNAEYEDITTMSERTYDYEESLKELDLGNLNFADGLDVYIPEKVMNSTYIGTSDFDGSYEMLYTHYDPDYSADNLVDNGSKYYPYGYSYDNIDSKLYMDIGHTGFFSYEKGVEETYSVCLETTLVKTYTPTEASESDESYKLSLTGEEVKVSDALQTFQDFADDFAEAAAYPDTLRVSVIYLYESEDGYLYTARYSVGVDGAYAVNYYQQVNVSDDYNQNSSYFAEANMYGSEVNYFCTQGSYKIYDEAEEQEQAPELTYTAKYLSASLAQYMDLDVKRISLENYLTYSEENSDVYDSRLCWVFYFDDTDNAQVYAIVYCDDLSVEYIDNRTA